MFSVPKGALALVAMFGLTCAAHAQSNPNAAQIKAQLNPSGAVSDTTRGIKPIAPGGAPAPAVAAAPSVNLNIEFASGSATLTPAATAELDQLGQALTSASLTADKFKIVGHTDTTGDAPTNQTLSEARAAAVKSYLEAKFSIADTKLTSEGVGEADLLVPTPPGTSDVRNRRVEIINLGQ